MKALLVAGAVNGALAVALGAFGAHGLRERVSAQMLTTWETAAQYHIFHALALLLVGVLARQTGAAALLVPGWILLAGVVIFSGSLYLLVLSDQRWLGAVTPLGGTALIIGWLWLAWGLWRHPGH
jgi:uncharacterized membrane protein YgdD (TMEM256/DUF423 family)